MSGLFNGLEIGKRALATSQLWLNTIGHNIANVNTPGYTRQRVNITSTYPLRHKVGPVGTGVTAVNIEHMRDLFLNNQFRNENTSLGNWSAISKTVSQIENLFNEPNDNSLGDLINTFWDTWGEFASSTDPDTVRDTLRTNTNNLTSAFHRIYNEIVDLKKSVNADIELSIAQINTYTTEIASLNRQISHTELGIEKANDLRDQRDLLIDKLSQYVNVNVVEQNNGTATVLIGALTIVEGNHSFNLDTIKSRSGSVAINEIVWEGSKSPIKITDGELKGLLDTRDEIIPDYLASLDEIAQTIVTNVNELHRTGYNPAGDTGINFFDPEGLSAENISLSDDIQNNSFNIAAAIDIDAPGDNRNALAIADLKHARLMKKDTITIAGYYQSFVGAMGVEVSQANNLQNSYKLLVEQLENSRQSVQGVSLDEEMAQMIKYQHAYDAAARVITSMDQALSTVIKDMGIVGR